MLKSGKKGEYKSEHRTCVYYHDDSPDFGDVLYFTLFKEAEENQNLYILFSVYHCSSNERKCI